MRRLFLTILFMVGMSAIGAAAQAPVKQDPAIPEPPKLTLNDCLTIFGGLRGLDGYSVTSNAGKPNESTYTQSYKFANPQDPAKGAALRGSIAENQARLAKIPQQVEGERKKIFSEIAKDALEIPPTITGDDKKEHPNPNYAKYTAQVEALGESACHVTLIRINRADLKLDVNEIPGSVVGAIDKILDK